MRATNLHLFVIVYGFLCAVIAELFDNRPKAQLAVFTLLFQRFITLQQPRKMIFQPVLSFQQLLLIFLVSKDLSVLAIPSQVDVAIVVLGSDDPHFGIASLPFSEPTYEVAVGALRRQYNKTFSFTYVKTRARSCLSIVENSDDILAMWYYELQRPGRVIAFVLPGSEPGKEETAWSWRLSLDSLVFRLLGEWIVSLFFDIQLELCGYQDVC